MSLFGKKAQPIKTAVTPVSHNDQAELKQRLAELEAENARLQEQLQKLGSANSNYNITQSVLTELQAKDGVVVKNEAEKMIEGVFDGQNMIGADGQQYDVPANYASKSKLVEGDILKLTINNMGSFIYKQIKPIERKRMVGQLEQDPHNLQFYAELNGGRWKLLTASVTYFKGEEGDEVVFLIPADGGSHWAAVENIIKE